jgi:hypothetical protein
MADRDALFAAVAVELGFVSEATVLEASVAASMSDGGVADELVSSGAIDAGKRAAVEKHLEQVLRDQGGDYARALAAVKKVSAPAAAEAAPATAAFGDDDDGEERTAVLDWDRAARKSVGAAGIDVPASAPQGAAFGDDDEESTSVLDWDRAARKSTEQELKPVPKKK